MKQRHPVDGIGTDVAPHRPDDRARHGVAGVRAAGKQSEPGGTAEQLDHLTTGEPSALIMCIHGGTFIFVAQRFCAD